MDPLEQESLNNHPNHSITKINKKGDNGLPCLSPQDKMKVPEGDPLMKIQKKVVEIDDLTHEIHCQENSNASRNCNK